ncbi:uncharacterized protein LOC121403866 [Drosophila obscura]|uniref:uncharacterized protein LOC121403866 n=1 Tax=Drosophila obscura TaxID=7282 RepID=UPI001BB1F3E0|nr:uncharacterized protein LOC121403866 [Drosophila obscura]
MSVDVRSSCIKKKQLHHTLLHRAAPSSSVAASTSAQAPSSSEPQPNVQSYFTSSTSTVLLGTALINICHLGTNFRARALIDSGSEATFITERLFNIIKPPFEAIQAQVAGLNQTVAAKAQRRCHFMIGAASRPGLQIETMAYVLPQLAGNLPSYPIPQHFLDKLPNLPLADPSFYRSSQIDVLLGADILPSILLSGFRSDICDSLLGQETIFGWVLSGPVSADSTRTVSAFTTKLSLDSDVRLEKLLTKFWEVEDLPGKPTSESDSVCEENFRKTTKRAPDGRYIVTVPFKCPENVDLGYSRCAAQAQLKEQYDAVIQEYLELGHMTAVTPSHYSGHYYLPHHAVFKPDSTTTKLRMVFNASSPSSNGKRLNDTLHSGPVLQSDLTMQILRASP